MSTFTWDGDTFPIPAGWDNLSMEDWFYKMHVLTLDKLGKADELDLPSMQDEDGDDLDPAEVVLIQEGFKNGNHYECFKSYFHDKYARETGKTFTNLIFEMGQKANDKYMAEKAGAMSGEGGLLSPVEGISLQQWAQANAGIINGKDKNALIAALGIDAPKWDRVNAEWNNRMSKDTSFAIANEYGKAFTANSSDLAGAAAQDAVNNNYDGEEPASFEKFIEMQVVQQAADQQGKDPIAALQEFGYSIGDYSAISMYWSRKTATDRDKYFDMETKYRPIYEAKYGIARDEDDEEE